MAKYIASPWGDILGKLGGSVGGKWKGIYWVRKLVYPTQRGTLAKYRQYKDGLIPLWQFSYAQMNIRRAVLQVLGYVARMNMSNWIHPVWDALVAKRGWVMTGANAFVKRNAATLFASMPAKDEEFDPATNSPDLLDLIVSDGDLEPVASITSCMYDPLNGNLVIVWDPAVYTNGGDNDELRVVVAKKPLLESVGRDGTWYPSLYLYTFMYPAPLIPPIRSAGTATVVLPAGLALADLSAYVFFRGREIETEGWISVSKSSVVV